MRIYMTRQRALKAGFTHHGSYHGIPMWLGGIDDVPIVCAKFSVLEYFVSIFNYCERRLSLWANRQPVFRFKVGREIDATIE